VSGDASIYPGFGTCSSSEAYAWTLRSSGGGTFELVNRASGNCLSARYGNDYAAGWNPATASEGLATCKAYREHHCGRPDLEEH
jgi:hypothetical protein